MLKVKNLYKSYNYKPNLFTKSVKKEILKDFNLSLKEGENLLLYGESGCGKSTLAKILARIEGYDSGEIFLKGESYSDISDEKGFKKKLQYVFQDQKLALNPYKSAKTLLKDVYANFNKKCDYEKIKNLCEIFDFSKNLLELKPMQLSGGQASRLGLIRALLIQPKLLICDEITSSLDLCQAKEILDFLESYQKSFPITYIFISHQNALYKNLIKSEIPLS